MKCWLFVMVSAAALFAGPAAQAQDGFQPTPVLPSDVSELRARIRDCDHWAREAPYDGERQDLINHQLSDTRCRNLRIDADTVRRRHADEPEVLKALDRAS